MKIMETTTIVNLVILDESGSMQQVRRETIGGINELFQSIGAARQQFPEQEHFISFVTFNSYGIKPRIWMKRIGTFVPLGDRVYCPDE